MLAVRDLGGLEPSRDLFGVSTDYAEERRRSGVTIITTIEPVLHKENQFTQKDRQLFSTGPVAKLAEKLLTTPTLTP
jgi:hypothetical protein